MELYLSKVHSEENGPELVPGKHGIVNGTKEDILKLCEFFEEVKIQLSQHENIHMHFRDSYETWNKDKIDIEVNVDSANS